MLKHALTITIALCLLGCEDKEIDPLRLDHRSVAPRSQRISLTLDPDQDVYHGSVDIQIEVMEETDSFRFHARDLNIDSIKLESAAESYPVDFSEGVKGTITAEVARKLAPGSYALRIVFSNEYSRQGTGIYKVEYEGENYVFTQMEPESARESFPCWDAPEFKIPWTLSLAVPDGFKVYANTPVHSDQADGEAGGRRVLFEESKPMPSYLVALAVGDFEEVEVSGFGVEGRVVTPSGKTELAREAARVSPALLKTLEDYFEIPYPYRKLDQIAVPEFNFGAMENVGLITYRDTVLLRDSDAMTLGHRQWLALTIAHEFSHMWFGNLVTPVWWDDLWLNESFASWIATKVVNDTFPEFEMANNDIKSRQRAFGSDSLSTSRPIRRPIAASDEMTHLFDSLAYNKGMAVLDMVEDWMGEEPFQRGMIRYMNDHAWGNADAFDLAASLGEVVDGEILDIMECFVTRAGVPLIEIERVGEKKIRVRQSRYAQLGVEYEDDAPWSIPITLKQGDGHGVKQRKILLTQREETFTLDGPFEWLHPNANEKGYYRWRLEGVPLAELVDDVKAMDVRNRLAFINNLDALFTAGLEDGGRYLAAIASFSGDPSPEVRQAVAAGLTSFGAGMIPVAFKSDYARFLTAALRPMLDEIGMEKNPGEHPLIEQLRPALINALGWWCDDAEVMAAARTNARAYMENPHSVDPSLAPPYLRLAAKHGDEALFNAYVAKFESAEVPIERSNYLGGLSGFRDGALMKRALAYALSDKVPPHMFGEIPYKIADDDVNRAMVVTWLGENYPAIQTKIPEQKISYLPWLACGQDPRLLETARGILLTEERKTQGMEIEFAKAEAVNTLRKKLRERELENVRRFLNER